MVLTADPTKSITFRVSFVEISFGVCASAAMAKSCRTSSAFTTRVAWNAAAPAGESDGGTCAQPDESNTTMSSFFT
jgi:hypothetical protein